MFKHTRHYKPLSVDMAAMCDVAFLLLTFFILCTRPKEFSPININEPSSSIAIQDMDDSALALIMMGEGKVMYAIPNAIRERTLLSMGEAYGIKFSKTETAKFKEITVIGTPIDSLKGFIDNYYNRKQFFSQKGIPIYTADNQLSQWISASGKSCTAELHRALRFMIKADKELKYPEIKRIIDLLRHQGINKFSLYTMQEHHRE